MTACENRYNPDDLRSCFKFTQVSARPKQGKNQRKSTVYSGVSEHFKPIFNAVLRQQRDFKTPSQVAPSHFTPYLTVKKKE
jgi:hypothetical protein